MATFIRRYITAEDDFVFIDIPFYICGCDIEIFLDDIRNVKDYRFPIINVDNVELPTTALIEVLVRIHRMFEQDSKTVIINASRNYMKLLRLYFLDSMFVIKRSNVDAIKYYKNYMFERLWKW